jgi:hypothetical protein
VLAVIALAVLAYLVLRSKSAEVVATKVAVQAGNTEATTKHSVEIRPVREASRLASMMNAGADLPQYVDTLLASGNPDDWYRAMTVRSQCSAAATDSAVANEAALPLEYKKVIEAVRQRCSFMENFDKYFAKFNGIIPRAGTAGSVLAQAPILTIKQAKEGLDSYEWNALRDALMHQDGAEAWLSTSSLGSFVLALPQAQEFSKYSLHELTSALVLGLCAGTTCGPENLLGLRLCMQTFGKVCSQSGIKSAVIAQFGEAKMHTLQDAGEQILFLLRQGELERLGFRRKAGG